MLSMATLRVSTINIPGLLLVLKMWLSVTSFLVRGWRGSNEVTHGDVSLELPLEWLYFNELSSSMFLLAR